MLVAERMDKSLVLLAEYLCWELSDVLVLKLNSLNDKVRHIYVGNAIMGVEGLEEEGRSRGRGHIFLYVLDLHVVCSVLAAVLVSLLQ